MPFPAVTQNYSGRRVDLSVFPALSSSGHLVDAGLGGLDGSGRAVAGPAKAAQRYVRFLLTPLGTNRARPRLGSNFLTKVRQGRVRTPADLTGLFAIESLRVLSYLSTLDAAAALPDDERVDSVTLSSYAVAAGTLGMNLELNVRSGDTLPFLLPVVWNP